MSRGNATEGRRSTTPILLAAGSGSRFRDVGHKLTAALPKGGDRPAETVIDRSISAMLGAEIGRPIVVTGRLGARELGIEHRRDLDVVHNDDWASGQMGSVHVGIAAAAQRDAQVVVIGLADQPGIRSSAWRAIATAAAADGGQIVVATYDGRRANPVALRSEVWELLERDGDEGARGLMRLRPDLVVEVPCTGSPKDIDTVEDLTRWQSN